MRDYPDAEVIPIGKRACDRYGKTVNSAERFSADEAVAMANELCTDFREGKFDRLGIVYTKYISLLAQEVAVKWILPFASAESGGASGMIFEPDELTVLEAIASEYVAGKITASVRESFACEIASRKTAMDSAGKNAQEMIDSLRLQYNRARQSAITQEITEIVAGSGE
ncbi:aTP synthase gamma chain [Candidatus Apopatosoma intestinale]|nr:aTP synthase gamma chain [Candidatus Apopatosoma intestinale]